MATPLWPGVVVVVLAVVVAVVVVLFVVVVLVVVVVDVSQGPTTISLVFARSLFPSPYFLSLAKVGQHA